MSILYIRAEIYFSFRLSRSLNVLIRRLSGYSNAESNSPIVLHALEDFARLANEWIVDIPVRCFGEVR